MTGSRKGNFERRPLWCGLLVVGLGAWGQACPAAEPTTGAASGFQRYVREVETRLSGEHGAENGFLVLAGGGEGARLRRGELVVERLKAADLSSDGAMLHDWRGTAFVPGATAADFELLMRDFSAYPLRFAPEVVRSQVLAGQGDNLRVLMRLRQQHVITVVMETGYDVEFGRLDARHGWSASRSTRVDEIEGAGTSKERVLKGGETHGFLWRLNTYWSYEERDGGLYLQIESVSLTRAIPRGLGWAVGPFVESVPRESLEFTLKAVGTALRKQ